MSMFHSWEIAEYSCTVESGFVKKEQTIQDWKAWTRNTWQSRLIRIRLLENALSTYQVKPEIWTYNTWITNKIRAESNQSKLGNKSVTWIKHKGVKFKATHGNLMNLLDLAKSNRADN
jgi:hypothetical protein